MATMGRLGNASMHKSLTCMYGTDGSFQLAKLPAMVQVNSGPFEDGWLMKVKMSNKEELDKLMDANTYKNEID
jgi:Glycine cleavage H-protein